MHNYSHEGGQIEYMTHSRDRSVLGAISITSLISALYLVFKLSSKVDAPQSFYFNLIATTISSLNIAILFAYVAFGALGGVALTILSIVMVLWLDLRTAFFRYYIFTLPFFVTTFIGYGYAIFKNRIDRSSILKLEKLDEQLNLLSHDIKEKRNYIRSLEDKLSGYSILKEVAESLSTVLSLDGVNKLIVEHTLKIVGKAARVLLFLVDLEKQELVLSISKETQGILKIKAKRGDPFDHWVLRNRRPLIVEDITRDFRFPTDSVEEAKKVFRSLITVPLVSESRIVGVLRVDSAKPFTYTQDDLRVLDIISDLGAVAIQNAMLYSRTQELAIRDGLTGLYLRRYFIERFREEMKRAARKKGMLSLLMLDIDHFKDYNDRYGHTAGDLVLKYLGRKISPMTKEGDILARYGGDEIAILLFGADKKKAVKESESIQKRIEDEPLVLRKEKMPVTLSVGISSYPRDALLEEELIGKADERLYRAKSQGRNKICAD